jgi:hypothetical protein
MTGRALRGCLRRPNLAQERVDLRLERFAVAVGAVGLIDGGATIR